jgi:hypothetical protein
MFGFRRLGAVLRRSAYDPAGGRPWGERNATARVLLGTSVRAFPAPRLAFEAASSAFFTGEAPISCALPLAASTASPVTVGNLSSLPIIDSPVRS